MVSGNTTMHPVPMIIFTDTVVVCNIHVYCQSDLLIGDLFLAKLRGHVPRLFSGIVNKNRVELCGSVDIHLELAWISLVLHSMFVSLQRSELEQQIRKYKLLKKAQSHLLF